MVVVRQRRALTIAKVTLYNSCWWASAMILKPKTWHSSYQFNCRQWWCSVWQPAGCATPLNCYNTQRTHSHCDNVEEFLNCSKPINAKCSQKNCHVFCMLCIVIAFEHVISLSILFSVSNKLLGKSKHLNTERKNLPLSNIFCFFFQGPPGLDGMKVS